MKISLGVPRENPGIVAAGGLLEILMTNFFFVKNMKCYTQLEAQFQADHFIQYWSYLKNEPFLSYWRVFA